MATAALKIVHSRNEATKDSESVASVTDQQLVERVQNGDNKAFDLLVRKYQHKVVSLVSRYVNDHAEALDIAQEAFIKAWRALPNFRGDSQFYTWIYRIAVNTAKNYLVSRGRRPTAYASDVDDQEDQILQGKMKDVDTPEALALTDEIRDTVLAAIDDLPEDLRTAIVLREIEGMSYDEIADVMECPIGTVRSRLFRAREAIDTQIKPLMG